jgi:predicted phosphodiesterase
MMGFIERFDTAWLRLSAKVADGAISHGRSRNAQRVFCGHTHEALSIARDGVEYFNSGSWTQENPTYIAIDHQGPHIHSYHQPSEETLEHEVKEDLEVDFEDLLAD